MKQIQPVQIWNNGSVQTGSFINAYIINDNLENSATFYWSIYTAEIGGNKISEGNLTISEPDYSVWDSTADINLAAYQWICSQLGLTLI
jgi:hypothetical protein